MTRWNPVKQPLDRPILTLTLVFVLWKSLLLLIALTSPGHGYDTSAYLSFAGNGFGNVENGIGTTVRSSVEAPTLAQKLLHRGLNRILTTLYRWDAIYFVEIAERGYKFEQEWAFGWGYTRLLLWVSKYGKLLAPHVSPALITVLAGVAISHLAHYVAVISLYNLVGKIMPGPKDSELSFVTTMLHILSPAGIFLSAPYTESAFAALSFVALNIYLPTRLPMRTPEAMSLKSDARIILAGVLFGLSSTIRSNGLPSGLYFLFDIMEILSHKLPSIFELRSIRRIVCLATGGFCIAVGFCYPQYVAYTTYCNESVDDEGRRPWCEARIPSIYSFVQSAYWDVGLFRYWTLSNVPLFILAMPVMCLMIVSAIEPFLSTNDLSLQHTDVGRYQPSSSGVPKATARANEPKPLELAHKRIVAITQLALALLTLFSFHVQVINRVSSGYPLWYIFIAEIVITRKRITVGKMRIDIGKTMLTWMIMYAVIQAGLFASFLPPA